MYLQSVRQTIGKPKPKIKTKSWIFVRLLEVKLIGTTVDCYSFSQSTAKPKLHVFCVTVYQSVKLQAYECDFF
jgi:hypothetical protein